MKEQEKNSELWERHRLEQMVWQALNTTPKQRLEFAEEMLEFMYAAGQDYHEQCALLDPNYLSRRGLNSF
ncbi:hypothetical protein MRY87_03375 [bacterium]|nr:hypothetical protein [bacterium]